MSDRWNSDWDFYVGDHLSVLELSLPSVYLRCLVYFNLLLEL